jgi:putative oxidoreductase
MRKLFSTKYSAGAVNAALFLLRLCVGVLMMNHGYSKLLHFGNMHEKFMNFLGIGSTLSLALVVFAEFFCSLFLILGLFTRLATIPLIVAMSVALYKAHNLEIFGDGEKAALYLGCYFVLLLIGPGKASIDNLIGK